MFVIIVILNIIIIYKIFLVTKEKQCGNSGSIRIGAYGPCKQQISALTRIVKLCFIVELNLRYLNVAIHLQNWKAVEIRKWACFSFTPF
jgi:hypothetical protein